MPPTEINRTEADSVYQIAKDASALKHPIFRAHEDSTLLIWPESKEVKSLEEFSAHPRRRRGQAALEDPVSFIAYVNRFKTSRTIVSGRANETGGEFTAILDHHRPVETTGEETAEDTSLANAAGWSQHRAVYKLEPSPEWSRWLGKNKEVFSQEDFALFIEDNSDDIFVPASGGAGFPNALQMMEVALTLQATTKVNFSSGIRLSDGRHQLTYQEQIESKAGESGNTIIPARFAIRIPAFRGSAIYQLTARLRYRLDRGRVSFWYEIDRPHKTVEHAFNELQRQISEGIALPILNGAIVK